MTVVSAGCMCAACVDLERVSLDACDECVRELVLVGALIERLHHDCFAAGIAPSQHNHNLAGFDANNTAKTTEYATMSVTATGCT